MKRFFLPLIFALTPIAHANCVDQHNDVAVKNLNLAIHQQIVGLFQKKGIKVDPTKIMPAFTDTGFSTNIDDPKDQYVVFEVDGSIVSASGTKFYLADTGATDPDGQFYYNIVVYRAAFTASGYDKEGNAIDPHCSLRLDDSAISNGATAYLVRNLSSNYVIGTLALPTKVSVY